jgi:alpha-L-arabinofuranosidase
MIKLQNTRLLSITSAACLLLLTCLPATNAQAQCKPAGRPISPDLFGIFFEDLSYAADGGLYAELVQNRSFEYNPGDLDAWNRNRKNWNSFTAWEYTNKGFGYGNISVETNASIHPNNQHYVVIKVEEEGKEGVGLINYGFDGIPVKQGAQYSFSVFIKQLSNDKIPFKVKLLGKKGDTIALADLSSTSADWKKYTLTLTASKTDDSCSLAILAQAKGKFAIDMVSLFPQATFKNRENGLRADLSEAIAALKPKFMRFPGGCLVHGDGLGNMYRWKNTIGPVEERVEQKNIWNYHQTAGLGYFEYFRFCEDIGAKPLPVVAAAVSCQNSGGTWRLGGTGQRALTMEETQAWIQDIVDLIEWANGPATSAWGAKRATAGHPEPFNLQYVGIGNEDKITPEFKDRFKIIYAAIKAKHPEITIIGTVGPFPAGEDFEKGWDLASQLTVPVVDEHYYERPEWFLANGKRYDTYDRSRPQVYLGEYASKGNAFSNALAEAVYMTGLERNGDVVRMASYAPLLARENHTSWNPNLIYFTGTGVTPTVNYFVQQLFSTNQGDTWYANMVTFDAKDSTLAASCVKDSKTGDIILKIVNAGSQPAQAKADLSKFGKLSPAASLQLLTGKPDAKNTTQHPDAVLPVTSSLPIKRSLTYTVPAYSFSVIRIKQQ